MRFASIVQGLWNVARATHGQQKGLPLLEFVLPFGDRPAFAEVKTQQTVETQTLLLESWIEGSNAIYQAKAARGA